MYDYDILLINPPMQRVKPDYNLPGTPGKFHIKAMNPGLLSIGSYLKDKGFEVNILDVSQALDYEVLRKELRAASPAVIGVGTTSGYNYLETLECLRIAKEERPENYCIAGGQHMGPLGMVALKDCPALDLVVKYEGEWVTERIIERVRKGESVKGLPGVVCRDGEDAFYENNEYPPLIDLSDMPFLNYKMYPGYKDFTPFVEESRGCPFSCTYCASSFTCGRRFRYKKAERFVRELDHAIEHYGSKALYAILASTFGLSLENTLKMAPELAKRDIRWTTEFRVECRWEEFLPPLYEAGLWFCNVGLESASEAILRLVNKTGSPHQYIERAERLVKYAHGFQHMNLRLNFLCALGESPETIRQSLGFLERNAYGIDALLATTLFVVPGTYVAEQFPEFAGKFGSCLVLTPYSKRTHLYPCRVSSYFSFEETAHLCDALEKMYSSRAVYDAHKTGNYRKYEHLLCAGKDQDGHDAQELAGGIR